MGDSEEIQRIEELRRYEILDTPPDGYFDDITSLASKIFNVPIAIVSLVDTDRIWFKSTCGIDAEEIPRSPGLCSSAIMSDDVYIVEDAKSDVRTLANPLVAGAMGFQFYAAAPLVSKNRFRLGTICVIDTKPRAMSGLESNMLMQLSRIIMGQIELKLEARLVMSKMKG